jgi:hypothetical protein
MTCPHCSVRWGYENESKSTSYKKTPTYNYKSNNSLGSTTSNANLRSQPSKNSTVLTLIPAYSPVTIIKTVGDWYYVEYSYFDTNTYKTRKLTGYIHKSLIN